MLDLEFIQCFVCMDALCGDLVVDLSFSGVVVQMWNVLYFWLLYFTEHVSFLVFVVVEMCGIVFHSILSSF